MSEQDKKSGTEGKATGLSLPMEGVVWGKKEPKRVTSITLETKDLMALAQIQNKRIIEGCSYSRASRSAIMAEAIQLLYGQEFLGTVIGLPETAESVLKKGHIPGLPQEELDLRTKIMFYHQMEGKSDYEEGVLAGLVEQLNKLKGLIP